ncbi:MAG: PAS domain S-box protein [Bacteroidales bacterium]|nr:PAS domain S-box protein [Bacteroidales bacterium]
MDYKGNILVVDDSPEILSLLSSILKTDGYKTMQANNGEDALDIAIKELPDLIILDIMMPKLDGFKVCEKLKKDSNTVHIPIIFLSALNDNDKRAEAYKLGATDYIFKPFSREELLLRVKLHIDIFILNRELLNKNEELASINEEYAAVNEEYMAINEELQDANSKLLRAKEETEQREKNLAVTLNSIVDGVIRTDENGLIVSMNPAAERILGWKTKEVIGKPLYYVFKIFDVVTNERSIDPIERVFNSEKNEAGVKKIVKLIAKGEKECIISENATPIVDGDGHISGVVIVFSDITDKYKAENALKESEQRFHMLFNYAPLGYQALDCKGNFIEVNQKWLDTLGYKRDEVIGKWFGDFLCEEFVEGFKKQFPVFKKEGQVYIEFEMYHKKGHRVYIAFDGKIGYDSDNNFRQTHCILQDITELRKAENELKESQALLYGLFNNMPSGAAIYDVVNDGKKGEDYIVKYFNNASLEIEQLSLADVIGKSLFELRPNIDEFGLIDVFNKVWKTEKPEFFESKIYVDEKFSSYYENFVFKLPTGQIVSIYNDTTDEVINKQKLDQGYALLRIAGEKAKLGGWNVLLSENRSYWSDEVARIHEMEPGYSPLVEDGISYYAPEWRDKITEVFTNCAKYGTPYDEEMEILTASGKRIWVRTIGEAVKNQKGEIYKVQGAFQDISDKKQIEESLRKSEESYRQIANSISDVVWTSDLNINVSYVSPSVERLFGETQEEHMKRPLSKKFYPKDLEYLLNLLKIELENEKDPDCDRDRSRIIDVEHLTADGKPIWVSINLSFIRDENGNAIGIQGVTRDISLRKTAEEELIKAKERAEESDKLKSAFLANMSHEIRTPMNGILGFSELLKTPNLSGDQQAEYISIIEKSGNRMLNIINDIIDISKIESGLMKIKIKETNFNRVCDYVFNFFEPEVKAKNMKLSYHKDLQDQFAIASLDKDKLTAVLVNLVKNAIKYSQEGEINFGYLVEKDMLKFFVKDTGIGIPKDRQSVIFERFVQADIIDTMARQGAGLGLAISKAYVEMMAGELCVNSVEGKGSEFYFTIPFNRIENDDLLIGNSDTEERSVGKSLKVLIVEDDNVSEQFLTILANNFTNNIIYAKDGVEAVDLCKKHPDVDLILMDIQMPQLNGHGATKQIRDFNKDVVIIAQTAYGLSGDKELALQSGCNDYLSKPIKKEQFNALVKRYFG